MVVRADRRQILIALGAVCALPRLGIAQPANRPPVVGILGLAAPSKFWPDGFAALLRKFGLEQGRDFVLEARWSGGDDARLPKLAAELVASGVSVIVAVGGYAIEAARRATQSHPIVMLGAQHPVELGYIKSLAKPGGNVTGMTWSPPEFSAKQFEIIRDCVPGAKRVAVLVDSDIPGMRLYADHTDRAAAAYGITLKRFQVKRAGDLSPVLEQVAAYRPDALFVVVNSEIGRRQNEVVAFARERRLFAYGTSSTWADSGGVLQYGPYIPEYVDRIASYVHRLLRGANAADLPVEQPRTYRLVVNSKAAREIGYTIPQSIILRADRVIE